MAAMKFTKETNMKITRVLSVLMMLAVSFAFLNCANQGKSGFRRVHFDFDKSFIRSDMIKNMDHNVGLMKKRRRHFSTKAIYGRGYDHELTIEGHCDARGTNEYNYALGARRAESAKSYMVSHGVSPKRMRTVSYGEDRPLKRGSGEAVWYMNRRAEFVPQ